MLSNCMMEKLKLLPLIFCEKKFYQVNQATRFKGKKRSRNEKLGHDTVAINCGRKIS